MEPNGEAGDSEDTQRWGVYDFLVDVATDTKRLAEVHGTTVEVEGSQALRVGFDSRMQPVSSPARFCVGSQHQQVNLLHEMWKGSSGLIIRKSPTKQAWLHPVALIGLWLQTVGSLVGDAKAGERLAEYFAHENGSGYRNVGHQYLT